MSHSDQRKENVYIGTITTAVPKLKVSQSFIKTFLLKHFNHLLSSRNKCLLHKIFDHPSIQTKYLAFDNLSEMQQIHLENQEQKIARFTKWAMLLSKRAIRKALHQSQVQTKDVIGIVINTCTGYICPGLSTYLIEALKLNPHIQAYDLVGSGCSGAIPALQMGENVLKNKSGGVVLVVSVEICSVTFQMADDPSAIVSNALFSDGAACALLWKKPKGLKLVGSKNYFLPKYREHIRYIYKNGTLYNQLSRELPQIVKNKILCFVTAFLKEQSLKLEDIDSWAIHNGGDKILNVIQNTLQLSDKQIAPARLILRKFGNISSATVWFELEQIIKQPVRSKKFCLFLSFGAGFSMHGYLFTQTKSSKNFV